MTRSVSFGLATVTLLLIAAPIFALERELTLGLGGGYTTSTRGNAYWPTTIPGGTFDAHLAYGFTDTWGIALEGNFDLHQDYGTLVENRDFAEQGAPLHVAGPSFSNFYYSSGALSATYAIDTLRLQPYLGAGLVGLRCDQKREGTHETTYDLGIRIHLAADYRLIEWLGIGLQVYYDFFLLDKTGYDGRLGLLLRFAVYLGGKPEVELLALVALELAA